MGLCQHYDYAVNNICVQLILHCLRDPAFDIFHQNKI